MQHDRSKMDYVDHPEKIWVLGQYGEMGQVDSAYSTEAGAELAQGRMPHGPDGYEIAEITLHRPSLRAVYGGPTLIEALWGEMDRLMEGLMTSQEAEDICGRMDCGQAPCGHQDNGDKYRAQELAWVLAIVTNAYDPSVDRIREEAMRRWKAAEAEADAQEEALDPQHQFDAAGVNGYEL